MTRRERIKDVARTVAEWLKSKPRATEHERSRASRLLAALADLAELEGEPTQHPLSSRAELIAVASDLAEGRPPSVGPWRVRRGFNAAKHRTRTVLESLDYLNGGPLRPPLIRAKPGSLQWLREAIREDDDAFKHRDGHSARYHLRSVDDVVSVLANAAQNLDRQRTQRKPRRPK